MIDLGKDLLPALDRSEVLVDDGHIGPPLCGLVIKVHRDERDVKAG